MYRRRDNPLTIGENLLFNDLFEGSFLYIDKRLNRTINISKSDFLKILDQLLQIEDLGELKLKLRKIQNDFINFLTKKEAVEDLYNELENNQVEINYNYLINEFIKIQKSLTLERAQYYLKRLKKVLTNVKTNKINDINLNKWKEYNEIITDSLWLFDKRDSSGAHIAWYWGNFIPQIPHQLMLRFTKKGDWVLDPFVGSGTTLIECRRLGRNGIGVELNSKVVEKAKAQIKKEPNVFNVITDIIVGDSTQLDFENILKERGIEKVQLVIMHPPYHDIIKFTNDQRDLSNAPTIERFLELFGSVVDKILPVLEEGRYLAVVIGDKYSKGEWIPLGFYIMNEILKRKKIILKSIIVKNFDETRAKRNQKELWRYRALVGGFYVFKHEYILLFCKKGGT